MIGSVKQIAALAAVTATGGLAGVALDEFHGHAQVILTHSATGAAGETIDVKLQHRNGTDAWVDVPGAFFPQLTNAAGGTKVIEVDADRFKGEVRLHCTCSTNADAYLAAVIVGRKQYGL
ncbi:hypothetical protein [Paracoccus yeei]|uniref:hypothetical protein n=1 Tax=Paracoccus yeei TaxID=147645 RepID=UPI0028D0EA06|nr:hypothetical protein [Paracoccus yeei]